MVQNYYIPNMSDFFIGYEYEYRPYDWKQEKFIENFKPTKYKKEKSFHKLEDKYLKNGMLRVPYLNKEQLQSEGWKLSCTQSECNGNPDTQIMVFEKNENLVRYHLTKAMHHSVISISAWYYDNPHNPISKTLFSGNCKSINEFRKICSYLNII